MKKILLTTAACAVLATSPAFAAEGDFYVGLSGGWSKLDNFKFKGASEKFKSKNDAFITASVGYNVMDNARISLSFNHLFNPHYSLSVKETDGFSTETLNAKMKFNINTLLLNGYVDIFDVSIMKVFVGAGVGASRIDAKYSDTYTDTNPLGTIVTHDTNKIKAKNYFSYALHAGASAEVAPGVYAEGFYRFSDYGKVKKADSSLYAHQVGAGVRFEL